VDFTSWQFAFPHSTFNEAISGQKTHVSIGKSTILTWFSSMWHFYVSETKYLIERVSFSIT
jgi:hypothetical protein